MITLPAPDFTDVEIQAVLKKLAVAVKLLESVCHQGRRQKAQEPPHPSLHPFFV
jgi:hypothetical protein